MIHSELIINEHYRGLNPVDFGSQHCEPNHSYGPAVRTNWLLHYVVSGCGIFDKGGVRYHIQAGDMFVIAPYEENYYQADDQNPWYYIWIGFTADALPLPLDKAVFHVPGIGDVFQDALQCHNLNKGKSAYLSSKIWELFSRLPDYEQGDTDYVDRAIHCMNQEYANKITVSEIARRLGLNRSYFSSLFKEKMHCSPQSYLNSLRLKKAAELMVQHGTTPSIAAVSTGYSDLYSFSKMFKQQYGVSPRIYVRQIHAASDTQNSTLPKTE